MFSRSSGWRIYNASPDSGGGVDQEKAKNDLLQLIQSRVDTALKEATEERKKEVRGIVDGILGGLDMASLKTLNVDALQTSVRNMASEVEKLKLSPQFGKQERNMLKEKLDAAWPEIAKRFGNLDGQGDAHQIRINLRAPAVMTTTNTIDEATNAIPVDMIEGFRLDDFVPKRYGSPYVWDVVDRIVVTEIELYTTWLEEGDTEGAFAIVTQGGLKPLVSSALVRNYAEAKKVAGKYVVTEEFAKFRKKAYGIIRGLIMNKLTRDYEGLVTTAMQAEAAGYVGTTLDDQFDAPNDYDAIGAIAAQIENLNFRPDVIVMNAQDKWRLRLTKATTGEYVFPVITINGVTNIFDMRVVTSSLQTAGSVTIGEAQLFKVEEETVSVRLGYGINTTSAAGNITSVEHDIDHNRFRVIVEMWFKAWLATPHVGSFVTATFASVKAALLKP